MFGASQDRARQLAARKRRERIGSNGSHRSISSSTQVSQPSRTSSILEKNIQRLQRSSAIEAHSSRLDELTQTALEASNYVELPLVSSTASTIRSLSHPIAGARVSLLEQQRVQAEYLSKVLYDTLALPTFASTLGSQFSVPSRHIRYGSLGSLSPISPSLRNMTDPLPAAHLPLRPALEPHTYLDTLEPSSSKQSAFHHHVQAPTLISLRGGYGGEDVKVEDAGDMNNSPREYNNQVSNLWTASCNPTSRFVPPHLMNEFLLGPMRNLQEWNSFISSGPALELFLQAVSIETYHRFLFHFDHRDRNYIERPVNLDATQVFYSALSHKEKTLYRNVIKERRELLCGLLCGHYDRSSGRFRKDPTRPHVTLTELLLATDTRPLRSVSAPNWGAGQIAAQTQSGSISQQPSNPFIHRETMRRVAESHIDRSQMSLGGSTYTRQSTTQSILTGSQQNPWSLEPSPYFNVFTPLDLARNTARSQREQGEQQMPLPGWKPQVGQGPAHTNEQLQRQRQQQDQQQQQYFSGSGSTGGSSSAKTALSKLFDCYRESGADKDTVGVEGTMKYFQDIGVDVEGLESLAALEVVLAPTMGEIGREGFVNGWQERSCETVEKQKAYIKKLKHDMPGNRELFTRIYKHTFALAKPEGQKAVPLDAAIAYWELLFSSALSAVKWTSPSTPWLSWWTEFLQSSWKKSVNKDMWNETLKFAQLTLGDESMSFWTEESSWPSVIDDFVDWVKNEKRGGAKEEPMDEEY